MSNQAESNSESAEIIGSLVHYPSLEAAFADAEILLAIKEKMRLAIEDLERVVRRGNKADAEKATLTIKALQATMKFLDELETLRHAQSK